MDKSIKTDDKNSKNKKSPTRRAVALLSVLTVIFSALAFLSMRFTLVVTLVPFFVCSVVTLTCVFFYTKNPLAVALPFLPFAVNLQSPVSTLSCGWLILLCAGVIFILLRTRVDSFPFLIAGGTVYALSAGLGTVMYLIHAFGSVSEALDVFRTVYANFVTSWLSQLGEEFIKIYVELFEQVIFIMPSILMIAGLFAMWITKWSIVIVTYITVGKRRIFGAFTHAPVPLAAAFLLLSFASMFFMFADAETYYVVNNVINVLTFVFMGEGIGAFLFERGSGSIELKTVLIVLGLSMMIFILPSIVISIVAYYGAFRTILRKMPKPNHLD